MATMTTMIGGGCGGGGDSGGSGGRGASGGSGRGGWVRACVPKFENF